LSEKRARKEPRGKIKSKKTSERDKKHGNSSSEMASIRVKKAGGEEDGKT